MFRKILRYASQHDSAVWEFLEATTVIHKKSIKDWSNLEDAMFESFTKLRLEPANNCEQGKHTGKLTQKIVLACQTFGWGLLWGNNSRNFPLRPRGPTLLLILLEYAELCHDIRVLFTAENVDRIGIHQSMLSISFSARVVNLPIFVIVRV